MRLSALLGAIAPLNPPPAGLAGVEIADLAYDSRKVGPGTLFFAIRGFQTDGHRFVADAFAAGAAAAVVSDPEALPPALLSELGDRLLVVADDRLALARASAGFFGHPTARMLTLGVTGTHGKTSCAHLLAEILAAAGRRVALLGTVVRRHPGREERATHTTGESLDLQRFLREARDAGADAAVLEVSSHALALQRVAGCRFDGVLFNNLDLDHLDFHRDLEEYYLAKRRLFGAKLHRGSGKAVRGVTHLDDRHGARLLAEAEIPTRGFGRERGDYRSAALAVTERGIHGLLHGPGGMEIPVESPLIGGFNRANLTAAAALAAEVGIAPEAIAAGIRRYPGAPGRLSRVPTALPIHVFIDFAHSGGALENVLATLRETFAGRVIVLFGAGGDRDPGRRSGMGRAAAEWADLAVVTSDNPRSERPEAIIHAILTAYRERLAQLGRREALIVEPDRAAAIRRALAEARPGDVVCIAGKGHERGQILADRTLPFDDFEEARRALGELEAGVAGAAG